MTATAEDVARYTSNGYGLRAPDQATADATKAEWPNARTNGDSERPMFFYDPDHAQILLNETADYLTQIGPVHEGIEVEESLELGTTIPIVPIVPSFTIVDARRDLAVVTRTAGFAHDMSTDRFSVEQLQ